MTVDLDWENLGFAYRKLPFRYISYYKDGNGMKEINRRFNALYFRSFTSFALWTTSFEGLKAYRTKDGSVQLFRPNMNAERLQRTADRLLMPQVPTENLSMLQSKLFVLTKNLSHLWNRCDTLSTSSFDRCW